MKRKGLTIVAAAFLLAAIALSSSCTGGNPPATNAPVSTTAEAAKTDAPTAAPTAAPTIAPTTAPTDTPAPASAELPLVTVDWYTGLSPLPDDKVVNDAINAYLKEKINANVNLIFMDYNDWPVRMGPKLASGEDLGIVAYGSQAQIPYLSNANNGAYAPLDDLLAKYAPDTKALFSAAVWEGMKVKGSIYGIPSKKDNAYIFGMIYNATMATECGIDMSKVKLNSFDNLEQTFLDVKAKRDALHPEWADHPILWGNAGVYPDTFAIETFMGNFFPAVCNIPDFMEIAGYDANTVFNLYSTPEYLKYAQQRVKFVKEGICLYDFTGKDDWMYDGSVFAYGGYGYIESSTPANLYGDAFETKYIAPERVWTDTSSYMGAGTTISANCKEKERAMMILNLANTDPAFATMLRFGIEGEHYTYDASGQMTFAGTKNDVGYNDMAYRYWYGAPLGNLAIVSAPIQFAAPNFISDLMHYNDIAKVSAHMGFVFDQEPVANEIAACSAVIATYDGILTAGQLESVDAVAPYVQKFNDDLKTNGVDKIIAEVQKQIDAWNASK